MVVDVSFHAILTYTNTRLFIHLRIIHFRFVIGGTHRGSTSCPLCHRATCTRTRLFGFVFFRILTARYRQILNICFPTFRVEIRCIKAEVSCFAIGNELIRLQVTVLPTFAIRVRFALRHIHRTLNTNSITITIGSNKDAYTAPC